MSLDIGQTLTCSVSFDPPLPGTATIALVPLPAGFDTGVPSLSVPAGASTALQIKGTSLDGATATPIFVTSISVSQSDAIGNRTDTYGITRHGAVLRTHRSVRTARRSGVAGPLPEVESKPCE
jgi:hypothetical protein